MRILQENQYNQGIGKYKLLSATAGVGSIITTKAGYYILVSDVNQWRFISFAQSEIQKVKKEFPESEWYKKAVTRISDLGISVIDDTRFINFLRTEKRLNELLTLVEIPHLSLNDFFNTINTKNNPIFLELKKQGKNPKAEDFTVFATHFPKWFKNNRGELRPLLDWKGRWIKANLGEDFFSPPRDAGNPILKESRPVIVKIKDKKQGDKEIPLYYELTQTNLVLICPNGHLSDIPWSQFLRWKTNKITSGARSRNDNGGALFDMEPCCSHPELKWTESTTRSDGYASIFIECKNCELGSGGSSTTPKINLEGINNLKPICQRHKPWEMDIHSSNNHIPFDDRCIDLQGRTQQMQVALVTGNNVYFANSFSSLYIPQYLAEGISESLSKALTEYSNKYKRYLEFEPNISKVDFASTRMTNEIVLRDGYGADFSFASDLRSLFTDQRSEQIEDPHEHYRWQEYQCFCNNHSLAVEGLSFKDIDLPQSMSNFFTKIQQVEELKISQVQLDFSRVRPNERMRTDQGIINTVEGQDVFSIEKRSVLVLPANETFGEGIFIDFNIAEIQSWYQRCSELLSARLLSITKDLDRNPTGQGASIRHKIRHNGVKHLLIHTFAHVLMRELEFSCGYPTASLKERLYISQRMSGVLIYTSEGAEGSMGGLVSQGQPHEIEDLVKRSMIRALDCSSDPLCWESDGQGIFDLNLAACFSCALVSETACEERNLGLDRRVLIDSEYGFFKSLL